MSYEFTQGHNAWSQRVAKEHNNSKWFYKTVTAQSPRSPVSPRWKELSQMLHRPDYEASYDFQRSKSTYGFNRPASRSQLVSQYLSTLHTHEDRLRFVFSRQQARASDDRPTTAALNQKSTGVQASDAVFRRSDAPRSKTERLDKSDEMQMKKLKSLLQAEKDRRKKAEKKLVELIHSR